jgi:hypothetical protein
MGHETPISNPLTGNLAAIRDGLSLLRVNCALCHGLDAKRAVSRLPLDPGSSDRFKWLLLCWGVNYADSSTIT